MGLKSGLAIIKRSLFRFTASRGFFFTLVVGWMMGPLIYMLVWTAASSTSAIDGFTRDNFITYYIILIFVNQLTYPTTHWTVGDNIYNGTFSMWLLRPLAPIYEAIASDLAVKIVCIPFTFIFTLFLSFVFKPKIELSLTYMVLFIISLSLAQVLRFMLSYTIAIMALMTTKINALLSINDTLIFLLAGQVVPTVLLPGALKNVTNYLPYRYMIGFPVEVILGKLNQDEIIKGLIIQLTWIILVVIIHQIIWKRGIKHYSSVGG